MLRSAAPHTVIVKDKKFTVSVPASRIRQEVSRIADELNRDYAGRTPLFLAVLNGSFVFAADLLRLVSVPCQVSFVKLGSYEGLESGGEVRQLIGLGESVEGRDVVVVEDIVDTGLTMSRLLESLRAMKPASLSVCTLLLKPDKLLSDIDIRYCALRIPDNFVVGYGLDYDGFGRNYADIYSIIKE
ncbi:MAG: hypoxanthine phosphoribosyltransferase [Prevotellaceae bacterium]|nr:hypoxanthine phosphoribosyltransferase [Prevotellaceae bacterium]MCD8304371.1 hypoxanthine phosphoribosyltransferase [Prevotellaceae bacterium]